MSLPTYDHPPAADAIDARYAERCHAVDAWLRGLKQSDTRFSAGRGVAFVAVVVVAFLAWNEQVSWWWLALPGLAFLALASGHEQMLRRALILGKLLLINQRQRARRRRQWSAVPSPESSGPWSQQPVARDLDLFGPRSVFHWLSTAHTPMGRETLADWLMTPAEPEVIERRQHNVRALATEFDWRESLQLQGSLLEEGATSARVFVAWSTGPTWLAARPWLRRLVRMLTTAVLLVALAAVCGWLALPVALTVGAGLVVVNLALSFLYAGRIHDIFDSVSGRSDEVGRYLDMLRVASRLPEQIGPVAMGERDLRAVAHEGIQRLKQLRVITVVTGLRRNGILGIPILLAHWTLLWEFHLLTWLEGWQRRWGGDAGHWFAAIGQLEALASLATAAYDHPAWTFPRIDPAARTLRAAGLSHPLLADDKRVANDVELGPAGTFLLVTGSNMSGKSTLLRAIGVNVALAQAGGVVCARSLTLPPVEVATSIRVSDSLADGVSFFFAELLRLKEIVDQARRDQGSSRQLLYLLDEILQGTNSRERQTAVAHVIGHLLEHRAIGAVSTHDLELADCEPLRAACQGVHFRETLAWEGAQRTMSFDYHLRPGLAPTTNALVLLDMVGLGPASKDPGPPSSRQLSS